MCLRPFFFLNYFSPLSSRLTKQTLQLRNHLLFIAYIVTTKSENRRRSRRRQQETQEIRLRRSVSCMQNTISKEHSTTRAHCRGYNFEEHPVCVVPSKGGYSFEEARALQRIQLRGASYRQGHIADDTTSREHFACVQQTMTTFIDKKRHRQEHINKSTRTRSRNPTSIAKSKAKTSRYQTSRRQCCSRNLN